MKFIPDTLSFSIPVEFADRFVRWLYRNMPVILCILLSGISVYFFRFFLENGLGLAYNDARSHLDIGRRVVEGLKPGLAQLGSVWLPLPHLLMVPTIWNDVMWHTGLAGALQSMISYVATGMIIYMFLRMLGVGMLGRIVGVCVFALNTNIVYLQSVAMTELLLIATTMIGIYELVLWHKTDDILSLIRASFWIMLSTLVRYDGWFTLAVATALVFFHQIRTKGYKISEGTIILFCTMGAIGIVLWLLWNQLIFKDALYFAFGPFSAHSQQTQLDSAGVLQSKHNLGLSSMIYMYALIFNSGMYIAILGLIGVVWLILDKTQSLAVKVSSIILLFAPLGFNVLALYLGHSVLFVQNISGDTWFNVRYGVMMVPSFAVFIGYLVGKAKPLRWVIVMLLLFGSAFFILNKDAVTLDDARVGSSQKNVSEVSGYLNTHARNKKGFILISAASHDAIIFSSGLPMKRFIHEGTGLYWENAIALPDRWARWIVMRTNDTNDLTWKGVSKSKGFLMYHKVASYPFADVYELNPEYLKNLNYE